MEENNNLDKEALLKAKRQEGIRKAQEAKAKKRELETEQKTIKKLEEQVEEKPHPVTDKYIDPDGVYEFTLHRDEMKRHIPSTMRVWDEHEQKIRQVKLTNTESSPYVDEQDPEAKTLPSLVFTKGKLVVSGREPNKIKYLLALDGNSAKDRVLPENRREKGLFSLRDFADEKRLALAKVERELDAQTIVKETDVEKLQVFLQSRLGIKLELDEVKERAYKLAKANPSAFIDHLNDPIHEMKAKFQNLVADGTVIVDKGDVILTSSKQVIYNYDPAKVSRVDEDVAKFCLTQSPEAKQLKKVLGL